MGVADCGGRRVYRSRRIRDSGQKGLDWLVREFRRFGCRYGYRASLLGLSNRCVFGNFGFNKTRSAGAFMDDFLGFLDCASSSVSRNADLGFCGAFGKLGSAAGVTLLDWLAEKLA